MDKARAHSGAPELLRKYDKFVVLMMENRSFDHYFGHLSLPKALGGEGRADVDGFKNLDHANPDLNGNPIKIWTPDDMALGDIDHEWQACHDQFNGGKMDGFIRPHQRDLERLNDNNEKTKANCWGTKTDLHGGQEKCGGLKDPMAFYTRKHTPIFHALLDNYTLCDRYFCSVMGPTWPNRFFLHAATAGGRKENKPLSVWTRDTIWSTLRKRCLSATNFYGDLPWLDAAFPTLLGHLDVLGPAINTARIFDNQPLAPVGGKDGFLPDFARRALDHPTFQTLAREGKLPTVSIIDPAFMAAPNDDHPPHDVMAGQTFVSAIYKMLSESPDWSRTLLLVTYDEHGSFYDHVAPPVVAEDEDHEFRQLGFRVPTLVVGPYVKKRFVSKTQYDHVSFASSITRRFGLKNINRRVEAANDLSDCVDRDALESRAADPAIMPRTKVRADLAFESVVGNPGQKEVAERCLGRQVDDEQKKIYTDKFLEAVDKMGIVEIK
jgi:phospholipase C